MTAVVLEPAHFPWFDYSRYSFSLGLAVGGRTYLSGHTASEYDPEDRRMVVKGGMAAQARTAYAKVEAILAADEKTLADLVHIVEYVTPDGIERYAEAEAVRRELLDGHRPAVSTVPVRALLRPEARIEIEAEAGPAGTATAVYGDGAVAYESAGLVFLPSVQPVDAAGEIVGAGDPAAQITAVFETSARILGNMGLGLDHVVKTLDYVTPATLARYKETARVRKECLGPVYPVAAGIVMPGLLHPEALIQLDLIASREPPVAVDPGWSRYGKLTYSPAVRAGKLLFIAGQGAIDPESKEVVHPGDVVGQAEYIYQNILRILEAAGAGPEHLVRTIEYTTPAALDRYREVAGVRTKLLKAPYPASTGPVCEALVRPEMLIEVDPLAVLD
jgi:enamine deaminase RidA (YjgF/YER057c/UK114 family)